MKLIPVCGLVVASVLVVGAGDVRIPADAKQVNVSIVRRVDVAYNVVTRTKPLEFDATGPEWLRVYTRLWWPAGKTGTQHYELSLWQDDAARPVQFDVGLSPTSFGPGGRKVGQWRSFFIQVPSGAVHYRLALDQAASDTVAVRILQQAPKPAQDVTLRDVPELTLVEGAATTRFYRIDKGRPTLVSVDGPCRVTIRIRLSFDPSMNGVQGFTLDVTDARGAVAKLGARAGRSVAATYTNEPSILPSNERTLRFSLPSGRHDLTLLLGGTLAKSCGVSVGVVPGDKYE